MTETRISLPADIDRGAELTGPMTATVSTDDRSVAANAPGIHSNHVVATADAHPSHHPTGRLTRIFWGLLIAAVAVGVVLAAAIGAAVALHALSPGFHF